MHPKDLLRHCATLMEQLQTFERPADMTVSQYFREQRSLGSRERGIVSETVYSALRHYLMLEAVAGFDGLSSARKMAILAFAGQPDVLQAALTPQEAQWLEKAQQQLQALRSDKAFNHNLPQWLEQALRQDVGERFDDLATALLQSAPLDARVNTMLAKRPAVLSALAQEGISATATPYSPWGIRLPSKHNLAQTACFQKGLIEVQDEGSQLLALLVDAKRNEVVVDFCAGAGGKTLALGSAMRGTGRLYACDVSAHRLEKLKPRLQRSGLKNVYAMAITDENDARLQSLKGKADRVLVDAPCSGIGTLRRSPDLKWRQTPKVVREMAQTQAAVLRKAAQLLKSGGRLVYATCSLLQAENEAVSNAFTAEQKEFTPLAAGDVLQKLKVPNAAQLCTADGQYLRLWPDLHATDGFFAAIWQKR